MRQRISEFADLQEKLNKEAIETRNTSAEHTKAWLSLLSGLGLTVGFVVACLIVRSLTIPLSRMTSVVQEVAANDLTTNGIEITSEDEIGRAGAALNGQFPSSYLS